MKSFPRVNDCISRCNLYFLGEVSIMRRNKIFKSAGLGMLVSLFSFSISGCSTGVDNSKLVIGLECAYQPFNWEVSSSSEHTLPIFGTQQFADGYDIAVAKYLSNDLGKEVEIRKIEWDALIPALQNGEINMILAGMSSTEERRKTIDFTDAYLSSDLAFLVKKDAIPAGNSKDNPMSYDNLLNLFNGKSLVCQMGVVGDDIIEDYFATKEGYSITHANPLKTYPLAALDVSRNVAFAMPAELPVVEAMTNIDNSLGVLYVDYSFLSQGDLEGLSVNIGIKKGNDELRNELNASLAKLTQQERTRLMGEASVRSGSN